MPGFKYNQGNLDVIAPIYGWRSCQLECQKNVDCVHFVYADENHINPNKCTLKHSAATGPNAAANFISGPQYC